MAAEVPEAEEAEEEGDTVAIEEATGVTSEVVEEAEVVQWEATNLTEATFVSNNNLGQSYFFWFVDKDSDKVALKIKGLPYSATYEEISDFFDGMNYVYKSVVIGFGRDGRPNGFASILYEKESDAENAMQ